MYKSNTLRLRHNGTWTQNRSFQTFSASILVHVCKKKRRKQLKPSGSVVQRPRRSCNFTAENSSEGQEVNHRDSRIEREEGGERPENGEWRKEEERRKEGVISLLMHWVARWRRPRTTAYNSPRQKWREQNFNKKE